jgi:hypothetical protein
MYLRVLLSFTQQVFTEALLLWCKVHTGKTQLKEGTPQPQLLQGEKSYGNPYLRVTTTCCFPQ